MEDVYVGTFGRESRSAIGLQNRAGFSIVAVGFLSIT